MNIKRGDVYYVNLDSKDKFQTSGNRPCVIVQNNKGNTFSPITIICPITSRHKNYNFTHVDTRIQDREATILCEQIRVIDKSRLEKKIGEVPKNDVLKLNKKLEMLLSIGGSE